MTACPARDAEELKRLRREDEELKRTNEIWDWRSCLEHTACISCEVSKDAWRHDRDKTPRLHQAVLGRA